MTQYPLRSFKVLLVGDAYCGKSTLVSVLRGNGYKSEYVATTTVEVSTITFGTTKGNVNFELYDNSGKDHSHSIQKDSYAAADAALICYSCSDADSLVNVAKWIKDVKAVRPYIHLIIVGTKSDLVDSTALTRGQMTISSYKAENLHLPFLYLIRKLSGDDKVQFRSP